MNNGCYEYCTKCKLNSNCCVNFNNINAPVINKSEIKTIAKFSNNNDFYDKIDNEFYTLKVKDNKCVFYINNQCTIYNARPIDCRLFPYDIIELNEKYYLIIYKLKCLNIKEFIEVPDSINFLIQNILPWIKVFTDKRNYDKMNKLDYIILKEIKKES